ncbi:M20 peptidase aminoacylase family protein [Erwinia tasmaniensis]|uniref:Peptidase n=1 Tax=Erwinia tasmaniensis (strain DSM 17950 / CFBP 7177 / CIP 109463 / NCPPB 4357 / Et1/99) TaxID=465817 RepID=B2VIN1_ERWT9|nr:M20 peptidase aminoacylase family protein [Erwinia tasmaniensis]CAO96286.1 Putative peptidase [Erwinia tasmaniensis Et1/99]
MNPSLEQQLIAWRRELHQFPELSHQEFATTARIKSWLTEADITPLPWDLTTGVVAEIGQGEPLIALRADIDALPIEEVTTVDFRSQHKGVMHACGHDLHTSVMLGAAKLLKAREEALPGRVRLLFQPAEERFGGAKTLIEAGALQDVSAIFGMHNAPELPVGIFATRGGPFYANVDRFTIEVNGKGAHAARPQEGVDAIVIASQIVGALQTLVSRSYSPLETVVVSVTRIEGGNTWNVLPQKVVLEGTVRTYNAQIRSELPQRMRQLITGIASGFGACAELGWHPGPPALINSQHWAEFSKQVAARQNYEVQHADLQMGGEDFAFYLHHIPGAFVSIGSASEFGLHHPAFNPDEALLYPAAHYFSQLAEAALHDIA